MKIKHFDLFLASPNLLIHRGYGKGQGLIFTKIGGCYSLGSSSISFATTSQSMLRTIALSGKGKGRGDKDGTSYG